MTATLSEFDLIVSELMAKGAPRDRAELAARLKLGMPDPPSADCTCGRGELEAEIEAAGDRLMRSLGFDVVRLSQRRASKITLGVPDRYYLHRRRKLALWVEYKSATGKQRPEQREFQLMCDEAGVTYVLGGLEQLRAHLTTAGVATFDESGLPHPTPITEA